MSQQDPVYLGPWVYGPTYHLPLGLVALDRRQNGTITNKATLIECTTHGNVHLEIKCFLPSCLSQILSFQLSPLQKIIVVISILALSHIYYNKSFIVKGYSSLSWCLHRVTF